MRRSDRLSMLPALLLAMTGAAVLAGAVLGLAIGNGASAAPPGLTPTMVTILGHHGLIVHVDASATRAHQDQARKIAKMFGPDRRNPKQRVMGVSLGVVEGDEGSRYDWVAYVKDSRVRCYLFPPRDAPAHCTGVSTAGFLVDPTTLRPRGVVTF